MNWGGFASGFSQGLNSGLNNGLRINDLVKQDRIDKVREQGLAEAKEARDSSIAGMIKDNGIGGQGTQPTQPTAPNSGPKTGEAAPDTQDAQTYAVSPPGAVSSVPLPPPVSSPQDAIDQSPAKPAPTAPIAAAPAVRAPEAPTGAVAAPPQPAQAASVAAGGITPDAAPVRKRYSVGDASFDTIEEARTHAGKSAPSATDFFMKNAVPKISEIYLAQGDVDKAEAWDKYAKEKTNQRNMETWSKAWRAAQSGDLDSAANHVFELYKSFDDGVTPLSKETVKDKDGNVTGFNVKLKVDGTGETRSQFIDKNTLLEMGMSALSPQGMFEQAYKQKQTADAARLKVAADAANDQRTLQREVTIQGMREGAQDRRDKRTAAREDERDKRRADREVENITLRDELETARLGAQEKAKANAKIQVLKDAGWTADEIKPYMPAIVGAASDYKKGATPEESRRMVFQERLKDPIFSRKKPEEQQAILDQDMALISGGAKPATAAAAPGKATTTPNPVAAGAPTARGIPVYDSKTGKTILLDPVTRKPISQQ